MLRFPKGSKKRDTLGKLDDTLWRWFSKLIRLRDTDHLGFGKCCTCGKVVKWNDADAGHFVSRRHKATKFDERNVNIQCKHCNRFSSGEQHAHGQYIDKKHGYGTAQLLQDLSRKKCKLDKLWYEHMIEEVKAKVKVLQKEKVEW